MFSTRPATAQDRVVLDRMIAIAADWRPDSTPRTTEEILADPALAHYVNGWPLPGDVGVVAEATDGTPIGAAWLRYLPADDPGYGFVAVGVPELSIGVVAGQRGAGVG